MGARVYDPYTGTFTQPDPIQGADASNYGYANGDPVNETDLTGQAAGAVALDAGGGAETGAVLRDRSFPSATIKAARAPKSRQAVSCSPRAASRT